MTKEQTAGQRIIASAKKALAFAQGEENGCIVHIPDQIDTARIRKKNQYESEPIRGLLWRKHPYKR